MLHFVTYYGTWCSKKISQTWKKQGKGIDNIIINFELHIFCLSLLFLWVY